MSDSASKPLNKLQPLSEIQGEAEQWFITADGTKLFFHISNPPDAKGPPFVLCDGLGCDGYVWKYLRRNFGANHPMIHIHYRGHGKSDVPTDLTTITVEKTVSDFQQILGAIGLEQAIFCGHSMGVQVALEYFRHRPKSVKGLVLLCGSYEFPLHTWHGGHDPSFPTPFSNRVMKKVFPLVSGSMIHFSRFLNPIWKRMMATELSFQIGARLELNPHRVKKEDFMPYLEHLSQMDMRVFGHMARSLAEHSAADILPSIEIPTLVVAGGKDTFTPAWLSQQMHWRIRGSEYLCISDGSHTTPIEHPDMLNLRFAKFLEKHYEGGSL